MFVISKEKDEMFKFGPRKKKKLGMLLSFLSLVVMFSILLLYLAKGQVAQQFGPVRSLGFVNKSAPGLSVYKPAASLDEYDHSLVNDDMI